jgi:hypothetical protein
MSAIRLWLAPLTLSVLHVLGKTLSCLLRPWPWAHRRATRTQRLHPTLSTPRFPDKETEPLNYILRHQTMFHPQASARSQGLQVLVPGLSALVVAFLRNGYPFCHPQFKAPHAALGLANRTTLLRLFGLEWPITACARRVMLGAKRGNTLSDP